MFVKYLIAYHKSYIIRILEDEDTEKFFSVTINFVELFEAAANLGNLLLKDPEKTIEECEKAIIAVQNVIMAELEDRETQLTVKTKVRCRVYSLPICPELHRNFMPFNRDLGMFLQISATILRVTAMKMLEFQRQYICSKCKYSFTVKGDYEQRYIIEQPKKCRNPEGCTSTSVIAFQELDTDNCRDYQEVKIQEQPSKLGLGRMPNSMWVTLEDDLVDVCKPGDNVTICGIVKRRWRQCTVGKEISVELVFKANHILVGNNLSSSSVVAPDMKEYFQSFWEKYERNPLEGRNIILKSVCPEIFGMHIVKLALAVVLAGGGNLSEANDSKIRTRSEPHLLLVGDPGTGKSQLLRFAAKLIPRSVLTTGIGSTSAGLTVTAVMENGEWQLEAGALVMADGGICCIDEFNSMKNQDRISIHEAMEQQTISVAKASVVCKLSTRCTVLAATNPKGGDAAETYGIPSPLLSRFDVVLNLKDRFSEELDDLVADYVLNDMEQVDSKSDNWNFETIQTYFIAMKSINPVLTPNASKVLSCYYQGQRLVSSRNKARTTVRLLDSLIRLSQGHARLMFHQEVQVIDAIMAVVLSEASLQSESTLFCLDFDLFATFPQEPMESYREIEGIILKKLRLSHLVDDTNDSNASSNFTSKEQFRGSETAEGSKRKFDGTEKDAEISSKDYGLKKFSFKKKRPMEKTSRSSNIFETAIETVIDDVALENVGNRESCCDTNKTDSSKVQESTTKVSKTSRKPEESNVDKENVGDYKETNTTENLIIGQSDSEFLIGEGSTIVKENVNSKKRKFNFKSKKPKGGKQLTDFDMLNLIPSVADGFGQLNFDEILTDNYDDK